MNGNLKEWYKSKTVWAGIAIALLGILQIFNVDTGDKLTADELGELLLGTGQLVGAIVAIVGRFKATDKIG